METSRIKGFVVAGHEALFERDGQRDASIAPNDGEGCDVCGVAVEATSEEEGYAIRGRGRYLWTRGDERRNDEPPLCPSCAAAIGMVALHHWNLGEEEG